jgi:hypothetical protein
MSAMRHRTALFHPAPLAVWLVLCAVPTAAAPPTAVLGDTFVVNQVPDRAQEEPEVAALPNGGFVAVWKEDQIVGGVSGRVFDGDGQPAGDQFAVQPNTSGRGGNTIHRPVALGVGLSGRFGVVWDRVSTLLEGRVFEADGVPAGAVFQVPDSRSATPAATVGSDGRTWVVWPRDGSVFATPTVRAFSSVGEPAGPAVSLAGEEVGDELFFTTVTVAPAPDGGVLVVWIGRSDGALAVRAKRVAADGTAGARLSVAPVDTFAADGISAVATPTGFAAAWRDGDDVFLQILDAAGTRIGPRRTVSTGDVPGYDPALAVDDSGTVLVTWTEDQPGRSRVRGRCFDAAGHALGAEVPIADDPRFSSAASAAAGLRGGGFVAVWQSDFGDGWYRTILGRLVAPPTPGVVSFSTAAYHAAEGDAAATASVVRSGGAGAVSVRYRTRQGSATAGRDFEPASGVLSWTDGETGAKTFGVPLLDDAAGESEERATLELFAPGGGAVLGAATAELVIADDDGLASPGAASRQLTASDVECDRRRLVGLAERFSGFDRGLNLALTATGDPFGVLYYSDAREGFDGVLSFSANAEETPLLRNPERPQLPTVSLTRNELATTLLETPADPESGRHPLYLEVVVDPTLSGGGNPAGLLRIDNALAPSDRYEGGFSTDAKPGRGLLPLLEPCHDRLTAEDVHVMRVVTRILRASTGLGQDFIRTVVYRDEEPGHYRIEAESHRSTVELDLFVTFDADGALSRGELRMRGVCPPLQERGCSRVERYLSVRFARPAGPPGEIDLRWWLVFDPDEPPGASEVEIDWRELLAGTTWRKPL